MTLKGFKMTRWMYPEARFSGAGSVTHRDYRRQGYMHETKLRLFDYMRELGIKHYYGQIRKDNVASLAVARKLGYVEEGTYEDMILVQLDL